MSKVRFNLPKEIVAQSKFIRWSEGEGELDVNTGVLTIQEKKAETSSQTMSLRLFFLPSLLSTALFFLYYSLKQLTEIALSGYDSIGFMMTTLGTMTGLVTLATIFTSIKKGKRFSQAKNLYWRNFPALFVSVGIILFLGSLFLFRILRYMFPGLVFDLYTATGLYFVSIAIINYFIIYIVMELTPMLLTNILTFVIIGGVIGAMITNRENRWWQHNFSFLGTNEATNQWQFNLTLVLSAVLMIALIDYLFVNLQKRYPGRKLFVLRWILILIAINLGGVGMFPYKKDTLSAVIHNHVAANLVYLVILLIITLPWLLPKITREFIVTSFIVMGLLMLAVFLFMGVHYLSLTAFEFLAFLIAFVWLLMFFQFLQSLVLEPPQHRLIIEIKDSENEQ